MVCSCCSITCVRVAENDDLQRVVKELQEDNHRLARDNKQQVEEVARTFLENQAIGDLTFLQMQYTKWQLKGETEEKVFAFC